MMNSRIANSLLRCAVAVTILALASISDAATIKVLNQEVLSDTTNRPFFNVVIANDLGYSGSAATTNATTSTVSKSNVGFSGSDTNGVPLGVGVTFDVSFTVETVVPGHTLSDAGTAGLGVTFPGETTSGNNPTRISPGETLKFNTVQVTNVSIQDPLGQLQPGAAVGNALWRVLRSNLNANTNAPAVKVSSDAAGTLNVTAFGNAASGLPNILNDFTSGVFTTPISTLYVNTLSGSNNWPMKGIGYGVDLTYDLAAAPATRRSFKFAQETQPGPYDGQTSHNFTVSDTTLTLTAVGNGAVLDTSSNGVGVNSVDDDAASANRQLFIDGSLATPEAVLLSFDRDVLLESFTLGNLSLDGTEGVVLKFISGINPFTGLNGYSGDYALGLDSLTYSTNTRAETPFTVTYGKNGQDNILVRAGTLLSLTSTPATDSGFLLDMLTVHAVPEPASLIMILAGLLMVGIGCRRRLDLSRQE